MTSHLRTPRLTLGRAAIVLAAVIGGCGGSDDAGQRDRDGDASLPLGETHESDGVAITPTEMIEGSTQDLAGVDLDPEQRESTPYYLHISVENTGDDPAAGRPHSNLVVLGDDGEQLERLILVLGQLPACEQTSPDGPLEPGDAYETCTVFLAQPGVTPATVQSGRATSWEIAADDIGQRDEQTAGEPGGDSLPFGEPYTFAGDAGEVADLTVTPMDVAPGTAQDLAAFELDAEARQATPYYVRMRYEGPDRTARDVELASTSFTLTVTDAGGEPLQPLTLFAPSGSFPQCESQSRMSDAGQPGDPYETCEIFLSQAGAEPSTVSFDPGTGGSAPPITWAVP